MSYPFATLVCVLAGVFFLPSFIGHSRRAAGIRNISALNALALLTLVCSLAWSWSLLAPGAVWAAALVLAVVADRKLSAQPVAPPILSGNSVASGRPPSVSRRQLTIDERYCKVRSTLESLAAIANLRDEELSRVIYKIRHMDVQVGFHRLNLEDLVTAGRISPPIYQQLLALHSYIMPLWNEVRHPSITSESVWRDERWAEVANRCSRLLLSLPAA